MVKGSYMLEAGQKEDKREERYKEKTLEGGGNCVPTKNTSKTLCF